jgi:hypothetical protein
MQKQSQQYQKIVDSEINRFGNTKIDGDELALFIENKFPNNPAAVDAMKQRLGINITPAKTKPGELPIIQTKTTTKEFTAKEIYNKTKELGQEIKTPIKSGGAVFTPEQKLTDDTISTLVDFLKSKGVDLSKARQFWANYAPVRNQLVKELKPFLTPEIGTKTFADRLVRVAKGKDINNENFIKEVEGLVGEKIGVNLKKLLAKLSDNQKAMVASKASSRLKMEELKLQKKYQSEIRSMKNNTDKIAQATRRLEIEKRGLVRKIVLWAIKAVAGGSLLGWGGKYMYTRSSTE